MKTKSLKVIACGVLMTISAAWCVWVVFSGDARGDMQRTIENQAIADGHVSQASTIPAGMVACPAPKDAPTFAKGWQWFCPKAK